MRIVEGRVRVAASDVANFLACQELTQLDLRAARGVLRPPHPQDLGFEDLVRRGEEHELGVLEGFRADGCEVADLSGAGDPAGATAAAVRGGAGVIYQGTHLGSMSGEEDISYFAGGANPGQTWPVPPNAPRPPRSRAPRCRSRSTPASHTPGRSRGAAAPGGPEYQPASWLLDQAGGDERPLVDLPDNLLLAGVVLHDVLAARIGRSRGLPLRGGVPVAVPGGAPQPVTEDPMPDRLGAVEPENMQIAARLIRHQNPAAVPPGLADYQPEPDPSQRRYVILLASRIGHRQVDVDDGLGRQPWHGGGAHMLKLQHPPAQGLADPPGKVVIPPWPGRVGLGDLDASSRGGAGHPWIGSRRRRGVVERNDLGSARHPCSLFPLSGWGQAGG